MSTNFLAGAVALVALAFAPLTHVPQTNSGTLRLQEPQAAAPPARYLPVPVGYDHCSSLFGPTGEGWAAHRHWQGCADAGNDDHPHVSQYLHEGPHLYLDVGAIATGGPHDDF